MVFIISAQISRQHQNYKLCVKLTWPPSALIDLIDAVFIHVGAEASGAACRSFEFYALAVCHIEVTRPESSPNAFGSSIRRFEERYFFQISTLNSSISLPESHVSPLKLSETA